MTKYFQDLIGKLRSKEAPHHTEHHLFLLGTEVNYIDRPDKIFVRGDTFSYAAQLTTHLLNETTSKSSTITSKTFCSGSCSRR